jgi:hypothetical protein
MQCPLAHCASALHCASEAVRENAVEAAGAAMNEPF